MATCATIFQRSRRGVWMFFATVALVACATTGSDNRVSSAEPERLVADARKTLDNFLRDPDQTWVQQNLDRAKAVLIAPQIVKAGTLLPKVSHMVNRFDGFIFVL